MWVHYKVVPYKKNIYSDDRHFTVHFKLSFDPGGDNGEIKTARKVTGYPTPQSLWSRCVLSYRHLPIYESCIGLTLFLFCNSLFDKINNYKINLVLYSNFEIVSRRESSMEVFLQPYGNHYNCQTLHVFCDNAYWLFLLQVFGVKWFSAYQLLFGH